jgi:branched-chain amino acid transport system substrate-binding protein
VTKRTVERWLRATVVVATVAVASGCGQQRVVGILAPLTGEAAPYGQAMQDGMELAVEDHAGVAGDHRIEIVWEDTASDPERAATAADGLTSTSNAEIVIAAVTSREARAVVPVIERSGAVMVTPSATEPDLTRGSRSVFRIVPSGDLEARRAGRFLLEERKCQRVVVVTDGRAASRAYDASFREMYVDALGGQVVDHVVVAGVDDTDAVVTSLAAYRPDGLYIIAPAGLTVAAIRAVRQASFAGTICAGASLNVGSTVAERAAELEDVYFPQPAFDPDTPLPAASAFVMRFRERHGRDPDLYAALAYDAVRLALQAAGEARAWDGAEVRKALQFGVEEYPGVTGTIRFNDYGDVQRHPIMYLVRNGQVQNYERFLDSEKARIRAEIRNLLVGA